MAKLHANFQDGKITIDLEDIKEDETILRELSKTVVFDNTLMECFAKLLVSDWIEYFERCSYGGHLTYLPVGVYGNGQTK
jgi:hypothetical protein